MSDITKTTVPFTRVVTIIIVTITVLVPVSVAFETFHSDSKQINLRIDYIQMQIDLIKESQQLENIERKELAKENTEKMDKILEEVKQIRIDNAK